MRYPIWTSAGGTKIPINKMSDSHLCNTLRMIKRVAQVTREHEIGVMYSVASTLQGDMATYYAERDIDRAERGDWTDWVPPIFHAMEELARKRKLEWETQSNV